MSHYSKSEVRGTWKLNKHYPIHTVSTHHGHQQQDICYMTRMRGLHPDKNTNDLPYLFCVRHINDVRSKAPTWWRHQMETFSALLAICAGNSPVPGEFTTQKPVTRSLMFTCVWINGWVNNREAGDLRRYWAHYGVTVMKHARNELIFN